MSQGFFDLKGPEDILKKLRRELDRLKKYPGDVDAAQGFFISAAHLPEWIRGKKYKRQLIQPDYANPMPRICDELANIGKHSMTDSPQLIKNTEYYSYCERGYVEPGYSKESLIVQLTEKGKEALFLNDYRVDVVYLANKVLEFWEGELQ